MDESNQLEEKEINLLELIQVLVKRKLLILKVCLVAIVAAVAYSLTLPNIYSATAKVLPPQKESGGGLSAMLAQVGGGGLASLVGGFSGGTDLYIGILKSRSVGDAVIKRLNLTSVYKTSSLDAARGILHEALNVQAGKDGIVSITVEDKDPARSALLANTFAYELEKMTVHLNLAKVGGERQFLEKRLAEVKKDLHAAEDDLKTFSQRNKIVQVDSQAKASIEGLARLRAELANKEVQLAALRSHQTEQSPDVKTLSSGIARLKQEIGNLSDKNGSSEGIPSMGNVPGLGLEYTRKLRELKTQEAVFEQLTKQYEMAKLSEERDSSSLQILDDAIVPTKKARPARSRIVITASLVSFTLAVCLAFLLEYVEKLPEEEKLKLKNLKKQLISFR